ncbi:phage head closure protein [Salinicola sp. LHM]|uniref:phage head closure protein n=1 Tax=Salinicola sp. LHM TaxID=3065298 RepID=UPI002ACEA8F8|nr:phage head closure protein [Salinicola sp. LHM]WQH34031.1 phage head closure protein [Salinicola sp. LHM]
MRAGQLRHRITLEWYREGQRSDSGATPTEWIPEAQSRWAEVKPLSTRMTFEADKANSDTTHTVRLRWRQDIANATGETLRLVHEGRIYRVDGRPMDKDGRRRELEIRCHEWV